MRVPEFQGQTEVKDLPEVKQTINTADYHFVGATQTALANLGEQLGQHAQHVLSQLQAEHVQAANKARVQEAQNQTQQTINQLLYAADGLLQKQGAEVFQAQANQQSASTNTLQALAEHINSQADALGNEPQRQAYLNWAQAAQQQVSGLVAQHEGQQLRVYQRGVALGAISTHQQIMGLNYNDPQVLQTGVQAIQQASVDIARLQGYPPEVGINQALSQSAAGLTAAIHAALQHNDSHTAAAILQQFGGHMDNDSLLHNQQLVAKVNEQQTAQHIATQVLGQSASTKPAAEATLQAAAQAQLPEDASASLRKQLSVEVAHQFTQQVQAQKQQR
jgi:hypothetical protein